MQVEQHIASLKLLLKAAASRRDSDWAYRVCGETRQIHEYVWQFAPARSMVVRAVLPLLKAAKELVRKARPRGGYVPLLPAFAKNIDERISSLRDNYLQDRRPDISNAAPLPRVEMRKVRRQLARIAAAG